MLIQEITVYRDVYDDFSLNKNSEESGFICGDWLDEKFEGLPKKEGDSILLRAFTNPSSNRVKIGIRALGNAGTSGFPWYIDFSEIEGEEYPEYVTTYYDLDTFIKKNEKKYAGKTFYLEVKI